jgi:UPF0176 protein
MSRLRNIYSKEECLARVKAEPFKRTTISFYKYVNIEDPQTMRDNLYRLFDAMRVLGRIYVAEEGINAQISVPTPHKKAFRMLLDMMPEFKDVPLKVAVEEPKESFWKLTIKVRESIVAHGLKPGEWDITETGEHLSAEEWNRKIEEGAIVVDMRNGYESCIGHFEGAITPDADTFREELPEVLETLKGKEDEDVLLYCTGGIRCEPTSAWLKRKGFKKVHQLNGGIIEYAHQIKEKGLENKFHGRNYVFDGRTAEDITDEVLTNCINCEAPSANILNCKNDACHALIIQCENCGEKLERCCSKKCQDITHLPLEKQKEIRRGQKSKFLFHRPDSAKKATSASPLRGRRA